ncbi:MAG: autotransporter-associated beta strand repeat-containing protein [Verrucomicrobia bacterium]|nr:autotransporter-associated beta strand repeat-containing protein [Verrucomicrobiota bacterium]
MSAAPCFRLLLALGCAGLANTPGPLTAATWDGGLSHNNFTVNDLWSTPNNWVEGAAPVSSATTDITFALSGLRTTATQNIAGTFNLRNLTFAAGANVTQLSGNALNIVSGGAIAQNSNTAVRIAQPLQFAASTNITGTGTGRLTLDGPLDGAASILNFFGANGNPGSLLVTLSGTNRTAAVTLGSPTGGITPVDLTLATDQATGAGSVLFYNGNTLRAAGVRTLANGLLLNHQPSNGLPNVYTFGSGGDLIVDGVVAVASAGKTLRIENALTNFRGNLSGSAPLTKAGPGDLRLAGTNNTAFNGRWVINEGKILLKEANAVSLNLVVINVDNGLDLQGNAAVTLGGLGGSGALALGSTALTIGNTALTGVEYSGAITSSSPTVGSVRVVGAQHELVLRGVSSFGGLIAETGSCVLGAGASVTLGGDVSVGSETSVPGTLTVRDGGVLTMNDRTLVVVGPTGTGLTVTGQGSSLSGPFQIVVTGSGTDTAKLTVASGGTVNSLFGIFGANSSSGTGALEIQAGGTLNNAAGIVGFINGSPGVARVGGFGAVWNMNTSLGMGGFSEAQRGGVGSLRIELGGLVQTPSTTFWTANCRIDAAGGKLTINRLINNVPAGGSAILALSDPDETVSALTIGADGSSSNFTGTVTNSDVAPGGLTKLGDGTVVLSGPVSYTGTTRVLGGKLSIPQLNFFGTLLEIGNGGTYELSSIWGTNGVSRTTIAAGGRLIGSGVLRGSVNNAGLIELNGNIQQMIIGGPFQNSGRLRVARGARFTASQSMVNTGVLDLITAGAVDLSPDFVNQGVILDRHSVKLASSVVGSNVTVTVTAFGGHTYRVQRSTSPDAGFVDWSQPVTISSDSTLTMLDTLPPSGKAFYRVVID